MNHIVIFCDKTINEKHDKIDQIDSNFKTKIEKAEYEEIQKTIASKETAKKKRKKKIIIIIIILHQRKFKKYNNNLKYKLEPAVRVKNIIDKNKNLNKTTFADIL